MSDMVQEKMENVCADRETATPHLALTSGMNCSFPLPLHPPHPKTDFPERPSG